MVLCNVVLIIRPVFRFPPVNYYSDYFNYQVSNWHWKTLNKIARIKGEEANYFHLMHENEYHDLQDRFVYGDSKIDK